MADLTPAQTIGPFFHDGLLRDTDTHVIAVEGADGTPVRIEGRVLDGDGDGVGDAMVEVWQADAAGRYRHHADDRHDVPRDDAVAGFGRSGTDADGWFAFDTVKPGPVPHPHGGRQAPHLLVQVFARGLLDLLTTRLYFSDEAGNDDDPALAAVPAERRSTLIAQRADARAGDDGADDPDADGGGGSAVGGGRLVYRLDIRLQGPDETVFFEV